MRRLEELKSRILLTERSPVEEADALQNDVELLSIEERQELLQHMRNVSITLRHLGEKFRLQEEARRPLPTAAAGG
jgi:hypothetical protein